MRNFVLIVYILAILLLIALPGDGVQNLMGSITRVFTGFVSIQTMVQLNLLAKNALLINPPLKLALTQPYPSRMRQSPSICHRHHVKQL